MTNRQWPTDPQFPQPQRLPSTDGYTEVLGNVQDTVRRVEHFLDGCSERCLCDHNAATGKPQPCGSAVADDTSVAESSKPCADILTAAADNVLLSTQDLPVVPNADFDDLVLGLNSASASTISPHVRLLRLHSLRYGGRQGGGRDVQTKGGGARPTSGTERETNLGPDKVIHEDANAGQVEAGGGHRAHGDSSVEDREDHGVHDRTDDKLSAVSRKEMCSNGISPIHPNANPADQSLCALAERAYGGHVRGLIRRGSAHGMPPRRSDTAGDRNAKTTHPQKRTLRKGLHPSTRESLICHWRHCWLLKPLLSLRTLVRIYEPSIPILASK